MIVEVDNNLGLDFDGSRNYFKESAVEFTLEGGNIVDADIDYERVDGETYQGQTESREYIEVDVGTLTDCDGFELIMSDEQKAEIEKSIKEYLIDIFA